MSSKFSKEKRKKVLEKYGGKCAYCGKCLSYGSMQVDHIKPIYRGSTNEELSLYGIKKGTNSMENLNPSCKSCNASKSTFTLEKWREELVLKVDRLRRDNSSFRLVENFNLIKCTKKNVVFYFETKKDKGGKNG